MTRDELKFDYFDWMYGLVCDTKYPKKLSYRKLLNFLHNMDFTYQLTMDSNRFEDGIELRYRFGYENGYDCSVIANYLDDSPCSVLEMLIALFNSFRGTYYGRPRDWRQNRTMVLEYDY